MIPSTVQFITGMKLRELRRQREQMRSSYERLRQEVEAAPDALERLRRLYRGLQGLRLAGPLWQGRLEGELAAGQLRSEMVYLFGALLEEWARAGPSNRVLREQSTQEGRRLLEKGLAPEQANNHVAFFDSLLEGRESALVALAEGVAQKRGEKHAIGHILNKDLSRIAGDIYQPPRVRKEARDFLASEELRKELADALTIFLTDLRSWDWPAEGLEARPLWTRNRWRLYVGLDLPTACMLEAVGVSWVFLWDELFGPSATVEDRQERLRQLLERNAPQARIDNARRELDRARQLAFLQVDDEGALWEAEEMLPASQVQESALNSIRYRRREELLGLRSFPMASGYEEEPSNQTAAVQLLHAEIQLARAAFPEQLLYVVKIDLKDFYASVPHDVLLTMLQRIGVPEQDRRLFQRFLSPPLTYQGSQPARTRRGVPMGFTLSGALAELLLRFLDLHVHRRARVRIVRLVDDICLLTPRPQEALAGWKAVEDFCAACGLEINRDKSGAICFGGGLPTGLPRARPRWGMLELDEAGGWRVHTDTFDAHLKQTRQRVEAASSVFARVQQYNANVRFLLNALTLSADLGDTHRQSTWEAIRTFHASFYGPGRGIVAGLREQIGRQFQVDASAIPDAWIYWPLTAGGLGVQNPLVRAGQYAEDFRQRKRRQPPRERLPGWDTEKNEWSAYYAELLEPLEEAKPEDTKVMKTLVEDFIQRGKTISAGKQEGLSAYWRWVLYTYGPQILHKLGSFRFLILELVPMQLIGEQRLQDSSLDGRDREES